jgi:hypothetical protein
VIDETLYVFNMRAQEPGNVYGCAIANADPRQPLAAHRAER